MDTPENLNLDMDRLRRCGFPEVVYGAGKTDGELVAAASGLLEAHGQVLATRCSDSGLAALARALPEGRAHPRSRTFLYKVPKPTAGPVAVVSAGTSDEPVAEEAVITLQAREVEVRRFSDCGVAGIHRLLGRLEELRECQAVIAVAGMEGALASVVAGLVDVPVIGCPTSVGYGVADGGRTALHSMLAACAPGITVVNIDNGFGAGYAAATMCRSRP